MDFDHIRDKRQIISSMCQDYSPESIIAEIQKCELICANCHRIRTRKKKGIYGNSGRQAGIEIVGHKPRSETTKVRHRRTMEELYGRLHPSGKTGVVMAETPGKWIASITVNKQRIYLGIFTNKEDAIKAREQAELKYLV
jgi:hypothetical protein